MAHPGAAPARLGRYELIARLAAGGMGEIFLSRLEGAAGFEKLVVIKRVLPHLADDARFREMLIGEARIASMMTHANICQVYELGETDGQLYIAMEYLEGITLLPLLRKLSRERSALDLGFVAGVIQQAADALHYAHDLRDRAGEPLGIVHRDVTPSNLFLTDAGVVKILDFGIAKVKNASAHTQTGTVKGKYAYMAPEQLRGAGIDRRADVFALGIVAYEMLALRRLFQRKTDYLTFRAVMEQPIRDIRHYRPDCPDLLAAALARALDRDPEARFATARQFGGAMLDAIAAWRRPWTQGEISDFVRMHFAAESAQRGAQITQAVTAGPARGTMPQIAQIDEHAGDADSDDPDFPEASDEISHTPVDVRHLTRPSTQHVTVAGGDHPAALLATVYAPPPVTPPPAIRPASPETPTAVVMAPRRSLLWPMVAIAMVAIAGGALALVWRQTQNQPVSLVITDDRGRRTAEFGSDGSHTVVVGPEGRAAGTAADKAIEGAPAAGSSAPSVAAGDAQRTPQRVQSAAGAPPHRNTPSRYYQVLTAKQADANRCAVQHGNLPPGARLQITIAPDGHPRQLVIEPVSVDATPLGACIKNVFKTAVFPRSEDDFALEVNLRPPA